MKPIYVIILLICAAAFAVDPSVYNPYQTPKLFLCIIIPLVSIFTHCLYRITRKEAITVCVSLVECLIFVQFIWSVFSNPGILTNTSALNLFFLVSLFLIICIVRQMQVREHAMVGNQDQTGNKSSLLLIMRTIWVVGVCQALIGFAQYYTVFHQLPIGTGKTRMIGTIGAANGYGTFIAMSIMAIIVELTEARSIKFKIFLLISGFVLLEALLFNGSRGALLALVGAIIVFVVVNRKKWKIFITLNRQRENTVEPVIEKKNHWHAFRFALSIALLTFLLFAFVVYVFNLNSESSKGRFFVWSVSAPMTIDHPIAGVGIGRYSVEYLNYQARFFSDAKNKSLAYRAANMKQALSEYVQVACELGIVGALLFGTISVSVLWFFFHYQHKNVLFMGAASILIVVLLHMIVDTPLHIVPLAVVVACFLGYTPVPERLVWKFQITSKIVRMTLFCILIITVGLVTILSVRNYQGYIHWQRGYELNREHRWQFAIQEYEKALEELPQEGELLFHLGASQVIANSYSNGIYHLQQAQLYFNDKNIYISLSKGYLGLHQYIEAERYAKEALAMFPDHLAPHLLLGQIFFETGRIRESKESLLKCINRETTVHSDDVEQIGLDAEELWKQYYNKGTIEKLIIQ